MKILICATVLLALTLPQTSSSQHYAVEDIKVVCEWLIFQEQVNEEIYVPLEEAVKRLALEDDDDLSPKMKIAMWESGVRDAKRRYQDILPRLADAESNYATEPVKSTCQKLTKSISEAVEACDRTLVIFEEIGGDIYRLVARQSDLTASLTEAVKVIGEGKDIERASVLDSARRLLVQTSQ